MKLGFASLLPALLTVALTAQEAPTPERCRVASEDAVVVSHEGKSYRLADDACRQQFLSDPERYAQLYDALAELEGAGKAVPARAASLVPN